MIVLTKSNCFDNTTINYNNILQNFKINSIWHRIINDYYEHIRTDLDKSKIINYYSLSKVNKFLFRYHIYKTKRIN